MKKNPKLILGVGESSLLEEISDYFYFNEKDYFFICGMAENTTEALDAIDSEYYSGVFMPSLILPYGEKINDYLPNKFEGVDNPSQKIWRSGGLYVVEHARNKKLDVLVNDTPRGILALSMAKELGAEYFIRNRFTSSRLSERNFQHFQKIYGE